MVCIPCVIAPVLLFIWYKFIQPLVLLVWNPWANRGVKMDASSDPQATEATDPLQAAKNVLEDNRLAAEDPVEKKTN